VLNRKYPATPVGYCPVVPLGISMASVPTKAAVTAGVFVPTPNRMLALS